MPKERKQRGRRKKKSELEEEGDVDDGGLQEPLLDTEDVNHYQVGNDEENGDTQASFFGLLDESEQTYFKTIDDAMIADEFSGVEERNLFVENVYKEAEGKELKLATSPLGSKVLEQLLGRSTPEQVRQLFEHFQGNFHTLVKQRYASHVCEMLFAIASTLVATEMTRLAQTETDDSEAPPVSMESMFLSMLEEISSDMALLGGDIYASHVVRDTLLILQGTLFTFEDAKGQAKRYHGQKKFSWARPDSLLPVPSSFREALHAVMKSLSDLAPAQIRMTASQPFSVSFVQVLIAIEADLQIDSRPVLFSLLGGDAIEERDDYMESILREPGGSKLFESIIAVLPNTHFRSFYKCYFEGRTAKMAQNPITNFVLQKLISLCNDPETILSIKTELVPVFRELVGMNHIQVIQKVIEAYVRTHRTDAQDLFNDITEAFDCRSNQSQLVARVLNTPLASNSPEDGTRPPKRYAAAAGTADSVPTYNMQGVFLLKALITLSDTCAAIIAETIAATPPDVLLHYATSHAAIKILDAVLTHATATVLLRKRILNGFFGTFVTLAKHATGSHFVDLCWRVTAGIKLYKDRIAQELLAQADDLRSDYFGRIIWRNWHMDLYKNKRGEWHHLVAQSFAKEQALAKLQARQTDAGGSIATSVQYEDVEAHEMHADRASRLQEVQSTSGDKKKHKKRENAVEDEVDSIFKKRKS